MKKVKVEDAVGMILGHDLTKIVPGEYKGPAFKKGYIIKEEDIDELKNMGKNNIYVLELEKGSLHEDECAHRIACASAGEGIYFQGPNEGKINLKVKYKGLLKINIEKLMDINSIESIMFATLHNNTVVEKDQTVAGTRIIPLTLKKEKIELVEKICSDERNVVEVKRIESKKVGIIVTGTEVYKGRIKDRFGPVLKEKIREYGCNLVNIKYAPDDINKIQNAIEELIHEEAEIIITSGGMSVDADDVTPTAIRNSADKVVTYGSPVLPGAMFMVAYKGNTTFLGVPACGMYHKITVFDLVFPRILAGEKITKKDIVSLAHGGLCLNCKVCTYPVCPFGK